MYYLLHILLTVILLIASYEKTHNLQSKESCNQNPTYGISIVALPISLGIRMACLLTAATGLTAAVLHIVPF